MKTGVVSTVENSILAMVAFPKKKVSLDVETTSLRYDELELEGMSLCNGEEAIYFDMLDWSEDDKKAFMTRFHKQMSLEGRHGKGTTVVAHNIVFDMKVLAKYGVRLDNADWFDTLIAHHLLDENKRHGLKELSRTILGEEVVSYDDAKAADRETFRRYALNDAIFTWRLYERFEMELEEADLRTLFYKIEMPYQRVLLEMELAGMHVDKELIKKKKAAVEKRLFDLEAALHTEAGIPFTLQTSLLDASLSLKSDFNLNSTKQLSELLFDKMGLEVVERTPTGAPSVGKKTVAAYKHVPFVKLLDEHKQYSKLLSSFLEPIPGYVQADGVLRPDYWDFGTVTGRLSCSNPNLQQLPRPSNDPITIRECFVAPEGYKMITCDYSGQELRVLADISGEQKMIDAFNKGYDFHLATANDFYELGLPDEALIAGTPENKRAKEEHYEARNKAKAINFGMAYGKGAYGFSQDFGISEEETQGILDKYFAALTGVRDAIDSCHKEVTKKGYVRNKAGRYRHFEKVERNGWEGYLKRSYRQSFNFLIQGFSADMIRIASIKTLNLSRRNRHWDLKQVGTVHDENIYVVKEEFVGEAAKAIKHAFETAVTLAVPVVADVSVGDNYAEAK